jgi:hypothetical protein
VIQRTITRDQATFASVRDLIGSSLDLHRFDVEGRAELIMARIKCTHRNGVVRTARLHAVLRYQSGRCERYTEQANGNFKCVGQFRAALDEFATVTV